MLFFLLRQLPLELLLFLGRFANSFFHSDDIVLPEDCEFFMLVVLFLDHLRDFLELLVISLGHVGPDAE